MDVSASMGTKRKRMARLFFYWCVQFLRRRYDEAEVVFIGHTTEAWELSEQEFFGRVQSGGTRVSSAYELVGRLQRERFPPGEWNAYVLHTSDGDNFTADNRLTLELIERLAEDCSLIGYLEVDGSSFPNGRTLAGFFDGEGVDLPGFQWATARDDSELWPALKLFFRRDDVTEAVA
jgi:uncharacterized sporulation protein YeaH/YhbH (DUF444 family)